MQTSFAYSPSTIWGNRIVLGDGTMARTAIFAALFVGVAGFTGCMHEPKMVQMTPTGGVVAIPEDTNSWPYHYRDAAYAKIRERYPDFNPANDIVSQSVVPVGMQTQTTQFNNGQVTTTSPKTEFQIVWRVNPARINNAPLNSPVTQAGGIRDINGQPTRVGGPPASLNSPNPPGALPGGLQSGAGPTTMSPIYSQNATGMGAGYQSPSYPNTGGPGTGGPGTGGPGLGTPSGYGGYGK
jgi:hypothetical protein